MAKRSVRAVIAIALFALAPVTSAGAQVAPNDQERVVRCFTQYPVGRSVGCTGEVWYGCDGGAILEKEYLKGGPLKAWSYESRARAFYYGVITDASAIEKIRAAIRKHKRDGTLHQSENPYDICPIG